MNITNLQESPQYREKTLSLIEKSFNYLPENHFQIDFYPLVNEHNLKNCFILVESDEVIAHIGSLKRIITINNNSYPIMMYGGIAVSEEARGKGVFKNFFTELLKLDTQNTLAFLWSEKMDLYSKFGFHPCINLNSYSLIQKEKSSDYVIEKTTLQNLRKEDLDIIKKLYSLDQEIRIIRNDDHWQQLRGITSSELFLIKNNDIVINYFIRGKGQDLKHIIHEYGIINEKWLSVMLEYGTVWTPFESTYLEAENLYGSLVKINDQEKFKSLLWDYAQIKLKKIENDQIFFKYESESFQLPSKDFLQGIFGPGRFKELKIPYFFISGLDSI